MPFIASIPLQGCIEWTFNTPHPMHTNNGSIYLSGVQINFTRFNTKGPIQDFPNFKLHRAIAPVIDTFREEKQVDYMA